MTQVVLPLLVRGEVIGTVQVASRDKRRVSDAELELLMTFTNQAAQAIENARLYHQVNEQLKEKIDEAERASEQYAREQDENSQLQQGLKRQVEILEEAADTLQQRVAELTAEKEDLQNHADLYNDLDGRFGELKERADRLEQQASELKTLNDQLQGQISQHTKAEARLKDKIAQLTESNKQLRQGAGDGPCDQDTSKGQGATAGELAQSRQELEEVAQKIVELSERKQQWVETTRQAPKLKKSSEPLSAQEASELVRHWAKERYFREGLEKLEKRRRDLEEQIELLAAESHDADGPSPEREKSGTEAKFAEGRQRFEQLMDEHKQATDSLDAEEQKTPAIN